MGKDRVKKRKIGAVALFVILAAFLVSALFACSNLVADNEVTLRFFTYEGDVNEINPMTFAGGETLSNLPTPLREGYNFEFWCLDASLTQKAKKAPYVDATLYAKWSPITTEYIVTFVFEGGATQEMRVVYGSDLTSEQMPEIPEKPNFTGAWYPHSLTNITSNKTVTLLYTRNRSEVIYITDGIVFARYEGIIGTHIQKPSDPVKAGYYFKGWYFDLSSFDRARDLPTEIASETAVFYAGFAYAGEPTRYFETTRLGNDLTITGLTSLGAAQTELVVPEKIGNYNVTTIGNGVKPVFNSTVLVTVVIPSSVRTIAANAFYGSSVEEIICEDGVVTIGARAFANTLKLNNFDVPDTVTTIGDNAFEASSIKELYFSDGSELASLGSRVFFGASLLSSVRLPKTLANVFSDTFLGSHLASVEIFGLGLGSYRSEGGALYFDNLSVLVYYPAYGNEELILPDQTITIHPYAFFQNKTLKNADLNNVRTIYEFAFSETESLESVTVNNVDYIATSAFKNARALKQIVLPNTLSRMDEEAFMDCPQLTSVEVNGTLDTLYRDMFRDCVKLTRAILAAPLEVIAESAFRGCLNLTELIFSHDDILLEIASYAFADCLRLPTAYIKLTGDDDMLTGWPTSLERVGSYAFAGLTAKSLISVNSSFAHLSFIGEFAFMNSNVPMFTFSSALVSLGEGAFLNCANLSFVSMSSASHITVLPPRLFEGCTKLPSVSIPDGIVKIGISAFKNCTFLSAVSFMGNTLREISDYAFFNCILLTGGSSESKILPDNLRVLGVGAFENCANLTSVFIPNDLEVIAERAFLNCEKLTQLTYAIPTLKTIGQNAFLNCAFTTLTLPTTLLSRGVNTGLVGNPFAGCLRLTSINLYNGAANGYSEDNGVIYRSDAFGRTLYLYPTGRTTVRGEPFSIAADVNKIDDYAFYGSNVSELTFSMPSGASVTLVEIGASAFENSRLNTANISSRVYIIGQGAFKNCPLEGTLTFDAAEITSMITNDGVDDNRLSIGEEAFANTKISNLTLPSRVVSIGNSAFSSLYGLRLLSLASDESFSTLSIGDYAFYENTALTDLLLPAHASYVGAYAFAKNYNLTTITFASGEGSLTIGAYAFSECHYLYDVNLPSTLASMGAGVFSGNSRLTYVNFPVALNASYLDIPADAFNGSLTLREITIPSYIKTIGAGAFKGTNIETVTLLDGGSVKLIIGIGAFENARLLKTIVFPNRLSTIEAEAFKNSALESFSYSETGLALALGSGAFAGTNLTEVILNDRLHAIHDGAFENTKKLTFAVISSANITVIEWGAFAFSSISSIVISPTVTEIEGYAFIYAVNLRQVVGSFSIIGESAFSNSGLTSFATYSPTALSVGHSAFFNCESITSITLRSDASISVSHSAFAANPLLSELILDGILTYLGDGIVSSTDSLSAITLTQAGAYYSLDGAVYYDNASYVTLVSYPSNKSDATLTLDANVKAIAPYALYGNDKLLSIVIKSPTVVALGSNALTYTNNNLTVYVLEAQIDAYKSSWGDFISFSFVTPEFDGFVLKLLYGESYAIIDYVGTETDIVIRPKIGGFIIAEIGDYAFSNSLSLNSVTFENGVSYIGNFAFANCVSLTAITFSSTVQRIGASAFEGCVNLTAVNSSSLREIGASAFSFCENIASINLSALTKIGAYAFRNNVSLTDVTVNSLTQIGAGAFENCVNLIRISLPSTLTSIGSFAFNRCENLEFVDIAAKNPPELVSERAFDGTSKGLSIFVPSGNLDAYRSDLIWRSLASRIFASGNICTVAGFESYVLERISGNSYRLIAFRGTDENVTVVSNISANFRVTEIGEYAFGIFVKHITLSEGITAILSNAFRNAVSLETIALCSSLTSIGGGAFYGLNALTSVTGTGASNLVSVGDYAFYNAVNLTAFTFPRTLKTIGKYAFSGAIRLLDVTFNGTADDTITLIDAYAFASCVKVRSLSVYARVATLGEGAFLNCTNFEAFYLRNGGEATVIATTSTRVFERCDKLSIIVPTTTIKGAYETAWRFNAFYVSLLTAETYKLDNGFIIELTGGGANTASIINYVGNNTNVVFPSVVELKAGGSYYVNKIGRKASGYANTYAGLVIGENVTSVTIPSGVSEIADDAFRGSKNLTTVFFDGAPALKTIGTYAFANCVKLTSITIPRTVTLIDDCAFLGCVLLSALYFEDYAFGETVPVTAQLIIDKSAFEGCLSLTGVTLPSVLYTLNDGAFRSCLSLSAVAFANSPHKSKLNALGQFVFRETALVSIEFPSSLTFVGSGAFYGTDTLKYIRLTREASDTNNQSPITSAHENALLGLASPFVKVYVPDAVLSNYTYTNAQKIGWNFKTVIPNLTSGAFNYSINQSGTTVTITNYTGNASVLSYPSQLDNGMRVTAVGAFAGSAKLTSVTVSNGITSLADYAFASCAALRDIKIADTVNVIGRYAFENCVLLTDVILPSALSTISEYTFNGCAKLKEITIPEHVDKIDTAAFYNCRELSRIMILSTSVTASALGTRALDNTAPELKIIVAAPYLITNLAAGWVAYRSNVVSREQVLGDFIIQESTLGVTILQYSGGGSGGIIDFSILTLNGLHIIALANNSITNRDIEIVVSTGTTIGTGITNKISYV